MIRENVANLLLASVQTIPFATALYVAKEFLGSGCSSDAESHVYVRFNDDSSLTMCVIIENDKYCDDLDDEEDCCNSSDSWLYLELKNVCKIYEQSTLYYADDRSILSTTIAKFVDRIAEIYGYKGSCSGLSYLISDKIKDSVSNVLIYNANSSIVVSNGVNHVVASSPYEIAKYNVINRDELFDVAKEYRYIVRYLSDYFKLYISQKYASKRIFTGRVNKVREAISHMYDLPSLPDRATKNSDFFITYKV